MNQPIEIWILDDDPDLPGIFKDCFSSSENIIKIFHKDEDLFELFKSEKPDVFFLDYRMPKTTGLIVASKLPKEIFKVLLTGEINIESHPDINLVLGKPYPFNEINNVFDLVRNHKYNKEKL